MTEEQVLEKVKKLLNLGNASDSEESKTALAMAHELMTKYNVQLESLEEEPDIVGIDCESLGTKGTSWYQRQLSNELAKRYGCQLILIRQRRTGEEHIKVCGYKANCIACIESIKFAYKAYQTCFKGFIKAYHEKDTEWKTQARKAYFVGFVEGIISEIYRAECSTALVIREPEGLKKFIDSETNCTFRLPPASLKNSLDTLNTTAEGYKSGVYSYRSKNSAIASEE